ncbi:hypothetical protein [Mesorhizobium sp.]|uniref:hypothetical protein n=1 Tax=Mesorhizobium sp. TaxID=1871066 RepID=UPI0025E39299|nr:hypothetical protein [Mesorhizobium sp.]
MGHKIDLNKAGRRIIPIAEGANWHRAANCRTHSCPAALAAASDDADLGQKPIYRRRAYCHQFAAERLIEC